MPCRLSRRNTGKRSGANGAGSRGSNHAMTSRVTRSGAGRSGRSCFDPRAGRDDGRAGFDLALAGLDAHAAAMRRDRAHGDAGSDLGAGGPRQREHALRCAGSTATKPPSGCNTPDIMRRDLERRKAPHDFGSVEHLVRQRVQPRGGERAGHQRAVGRADLGDAGDVQQLLPRRRLKLAPQRIGPAQQRHVGRMLEIAEPDDAGLAVRRAVVVPGRKPLDAGDADAAARQLDRAPRCPWRRAQPRPRRIAACAGTRLRAEASLFRLACLWPGLIDTQPQPN